MTSKGLTGRTRLTSSMEGQHNIIFTTTRRKCVNNNVYPNIQIFNICMKRSSCREYDLNIHEYTPTLTYQFLCQGQTS